MSRHRLAARDLVPGREFHGFVLQEHRQPQEVGAPVYLFVHPGSGARLMKIAADDDNKTFCLGFRTPPDGDCGTPHILEHAVLNGSRKFPVRSPFDILSKGSLHTFLNALTAPDRTMYPAASRNERDYFNMLDVYCDAVFHPRIHQEPNIFRQEGWHVERNERDGRLQYNGVVYNEMKGAYSTPQRQLGLHLYRHLFPASPYGFSSGGHPDAIPDLTDEAFRAYHRRYYHPANCFIILYGDGDLRRELKFLHEGYLSTFTAQEVAAVPALQPRLAEPVRVRAAYAIGSGERLEQNTFLGLGWLAGRSADRRESLALDILVDHLANGPASPWRTALLRAGIGRESLASYEELAQNAVTLVVYNANAGQGDALWEVVRDTLRESLHRGFDRSALEGLLNRKEFRLREAAESDGLPPAVLLCDRVYSTWMFADAPFAAMEYQEPLHFLRRELEGDYWEQLARDVFLDNPHRVSVSLEPQPGLALTEEQKTAAELERRHAALSPAEQTEWVEAEEALRRFQETADTPEALHSVPMLSLGDIRRRAHGVRMVKSTVGGVPLIIVPTPSQGVVYLKACFGGEVLPPRLIPCAGVLVELFKELATASRHYGELDTVLNRDTGGLEFSPAVYHRCRSGGFAPMIEADGKAMGERFPHLVELLAEILTTSRLDDTERLGEVLQQLHAHSESYVRGSGMRLALRRLEAGLSPAGRWHEEVRGLSYHHYVFRTAAAFSERPQPFIADLQETARLLFQRRRLTLFVACDEEAIPRVQQQLAPLPGLLGDESFRAVPCPPPLAGGNEGLLSASNVQYVLQGGDLRAAGVTHSGHLAVLGHILSTEYLQQTVRVKGGAYGGFAAFSPSGFGYLGSYRDPNLAETLEIYRGAPEFVRRFSASAEEMTRFIIGTVSHLDPLILPNARCRQAAVRRFEQRGQAERQREREEVLATTPEHIRALAEPLQALLEQNRFCVYGGEAQLNANRGLFRSIIPVLEPR